MPARLWSALPLAMESDSDDAGELTGMLPLPAGGGGARPSHARIPSVPPVFSFEKRAAPRDDLGLGTSDTVGGGLANSASTPSRTACRAARNTPQRVIDEQRSFWGERGARAGSSLGELIPTRAYSPFLR